MKIIRAAALALCLVLAICSAAGAEGTFYGSVVCEKTTTVDAPFGGQVGLIAFSAGSRIVKGDEICKIGTTKVCAPADGTVSVVFVQPGDNLETVKNLYGGAVYITPDEKYTVNANNRTADKNAGSFSIGQTVYLRSGRAKNAKDGTGYIFSTAASQMENDTTLSYKVRVTGGDFYMNEKVTVYQTAACAAGESLGQGKIEMTSPVIVNGDGCALRVHVDAGDTVKRGDLLFETVAGNLDDMTAPDDVVTASVTGIVASCDVSAGATVEKGAAILKIYPEDALQASVTVAEPELEKLTPGSPVELTFSQSKQTVEGTVASVSYVSSSENNGSGYASYTVYIDFDADENTRLGMLVEVSVP